MDQGQEPQQPKVGRRRRRAKGKDSMRRVRALHGFDVETRDQNQPETCTNMPERPASYFVGHCATRVWPQKLKRISNSPTVTKETATVHDGGDDEVEANDAVPSLIVSKIRGELLPPPQSTLPSLTGIDLVVAATTARCSRHQPSSSWPHFSSSSTMTTTTTTSSIIMAKQQMVAAAQPASDLVDLLLRLLTASSSKTCWIDHGFVTASAVVAVGATGTGAIAVDNKKKNRDKFLKAHRAFLERRFWCYRRICFEALIVPRCLAMPDSCSPDMLMMKRCAAILAYRYARVIVTASASPSESESELAVVRYSKKNNLELPVLRGGLHLRRRRHRRLATQEEVIKAILAAQKLLSRGVTSVESTFRAVDHNIRRAAPALKDLVRMLLTHVVLPTARGTWTVTKAYVKACVKALCATLRLLALLVFVILPRITFKVVVATARVLYCVLAVIGSCMWWVISAGLAVDTDCNAASVPAKKKKVSHWSLMEDMKDRKVNDIWYRAASSPVPVMCRGVHAAPSRKRGMNVVTEVAVAPTMKKIKSQAVRTMEAKRSLNLQDDFYRKLAMAAQRWATHSLAAATYRKQVFRPFQEGDIVMKKYGRAARIAAAKQSLADHEAYLRAQALARTRRYKMVGGSTNSQSQRDDDGTPDLF